MLFGWPGWVNKDDCSEPLGNFLIGCAVVFGIIILTRLCHSGIFGTGVEEHGPISIVLHILDFISGFIGCFMCFWVCLGMYWAWNTEKELCQGENGGYMYYETIVIICLNLLWLPCMCGVIALGVM